jgi:hypothetical protein
MGFCHGNGNIGTDSCCWVAGEICPLRVKVVGTKIQRGPGGELGRDAFLNSMGGEKADRAATQLEGVTYACKAALDVIADDPALRFRRSEFEEAWNNHPEYLELVRPHWEELEERLELEPGSYQCSTWVGIRRPECCFAEPEEENEEKARGLSQSAVAIRKAVKR